MFNFFALPIYIQIYKNSFKLTACDDSDRTITVHSDTPFTTQRLLVGHFRIAESTLCDAMNHMRGTGIFKKTANAVVQPMEMVEGGICEIEDKVFRELALGAGAVKISIHVGSTLSKQQVLEKIKAI